MKKKKKSYPGYYTFDEILNYWRGHNKNIHPDVLKRFFRTQRIRPNTDHVYHQSVLTTMLRHMFELLRDSAAMEAEKYDDIQEPSTSDRHYHPKGISKASLELLKNDDIWYGDDDDDEEDDLEEESIARAIRGTLIEMKLW